MMEIDSELVNDVEDVFIEGDGRFDLEVIGVSDHRRHLKFLAESRSCRSPSNGLIAKLHYENVNPNDKNAIRVVVNGGTIGYLSYEDAKLYRRRVEEVGLEGIIVSCKARITGGNRTWLFKRTNIEFHLDLPIKNL